MVEHIDQESKLERRTLRKANELFLRLLQEQALEQRRLQQRVDGTTGLVADRLQRNAVLIELNPTYAAMSSNRIKDDAPLFVEVAP